MAGFLAKLGILFLLFFPTQGFFTAKIDSYLAPATTETMKKIEEFEKTADALPNPTGQTGAEIIEESHTWREKIAELKDSITNKVGQYSPAAIVKKANDLMDVADKQVARLFEVFAIFALSVIVVPIGVIIVYWKLFTLLGSGLMDSSRPVCMYQARKG